MKKHACKECPFNKKANLTIDNLGGSEPEVYLGQINGPFWLPCHMDKNYKGKQSSPESVSICAGAAKLRNKLPIRDAFEALNNKLIPVIEDPDNQSFDSCADFLSHYKKIPLEEAEKLTTRAHLKSYMKAELDKITEKNIISVAGE